MVQAKYIWAGDKSLNATIPQLEDPQWLKETLKEANECPCSSFCGETIEGELDGMPVLLEIAVAVLWKCDEYPWDIVVVADFATVDDEYSWVETRHIAIEIQRQSTAMYLEPQQSDKPKGWEALKDWRPSFYKKGIEEYFPNDGT